MTDRVPLDLTVFRPDGTPTTLGGLFGGSRFLLVVFLRHLA